MRILNKKLFQLKYQIIYPYYFNLEFSVKKNTNKRYPDVIC